LPVWIESFTDGAHAEQNGGRRAERVERVDPDPLCRVSIRGKGGEQIADGSR
jgi:hypothetical protein